MKICKIIRKFCKSSAATIIATGILFATVPAITTWSGIFSGGNQGSGFGSSAGHYNSNGYNYHSAAAYAFYITGNNWISAETSAQIRSGQIDSFKATDEVNNYLKDHYPKWASGTSYVYIAPTFETPGESSAYAEMEGISYVKEVSGNYDAINAGDDSTLWKPTAPCDNPDYNTDGRAYLYNKLKENGEISNVDWRNAVSESQAKAIYTWLVQGGSSNLRDRVDQFTYQYAQPGSAGWENSTNEDISLWQYAAYVDLLVIVPCKISICYNWISTGGC